MATPSAPMAAATRRPGRRAERADHYYAHRNEPDMAGDQVDYVPPRAARVAVRLSVDEARARIDDAWQTLTQW